MVKNYFPLVFVFFFLSNIHSQTTAIPDANFEQALIDLGIDSDATINGSVLTADISGVTSLNVGSKNISDLTGIEDFTNLTSLSCWGNQLINLDVSSNSALTYLSCNGNNLSSLNVSSNTALTDLLCNTNNLSSLDVSNNTLLTNLDCNNNKLISLNVDNNTELDILSCHLNSLISLDVSSNNKLTQLYCNQNSLSSLNVNTTLNYLFCDGNNNISSLDLSNNTALFYLSCNNNQLASLNVKNGNNSIITTLNAENNPSLTCIQVDNETDANAGTGVYSSWLKDVTANYSEDCGYSLSIDDELLAQGLNLYPNPVSDILTIDSEIPLTKVEVYSMLGKMVKEIDSGFNSISTDNLSNGVYFVRIHSENGLITKKLIKK